MSKWSPNKKTEFKLSEKAAEAQVRELLDFYSIDVDEIESEEMKAATETGFNRLQNYFRRGLIEIRRDAGKFVIVQHLEAAPGDIKEIVYQELRGELKAAMDGFKQTDSYKRQHALLGALSGLGDTAIRALRGVDLSVAETLALVFMSA